MPSSPVAQFEEMVSNRSLKDAAAFLMKQPFSSPPAEWLKTNYFLMGLHPKSSRTGSKFNLSHVIGLHHALAGKGFVTSNPNHVAEALVRVLKRSQGDSPVGKSLTSLLMPCATQVQEHIASFVLQQSVLFSPALCREFVEAGMAVDSAGLNGRTALVAAVEKDGSLDPAKMLLDIGANPHGLTPNKPSPLSRVYSVDALRLLLDSGVDPNTVDHNGRSPLMRWVRELSVDESRSQEALRLLVERGADIEAKDSQGFSPFDAWAGGPYEPFLRELNAHGQALKMHREMHRDTHSTGDTNGKRPRF